MMRDQHQAHGNVAISPITDLRTHEPMAAALRRRAAEQPTGDTAAAYDLAVARLCERGAGRVAELGGGADLLRTAGLEVTRLAGLVELARVDGAAGAAFERVLGEATLSAFDTVVLLDAIGRVDDDSALVRALARRVAPGARLVGAAPCGEVGQPLASPWWRGYSSEALDALLVRAGWQAPVCIGRVGALLVFETVRAQDLSTSRAIEAADAARGNEGAVTAALTQLAGAARATSVPAEAREVMLAIGALRLARGDHDEAEQAFAAANAIAPNCARPLVALAGVALARGARDDAEALLDHALGYDASDAAAWAAMAALYTARGERAAARECLECAAAIAPSDAAIATELAHVRAALGDAAGAAEALERVMAFGRATRVVQDAYCWLITSATHRGSAARSARASGAMARLAS